MADSTREVVNDIKATGKSTFQEATSNMKAQWNEGYDIMKHKAQDAVSASEDFVRQHPLSTVLGACAVGFVAGLIARRNRH